jgi:hypothetical protein
MAPRLTNVVRRERTASELNRLTEAMGDWLTRRRKADCDAAGEYIGRYKTQLDTIERVLMKGATARLAENSRNLETGDDPGSFYDACRDIDLATVWLQRIWEFYRDKFDQRDDERLAPVLRSADEIVWSCYHGVMERARQIDVSVDHGAAPLAFIAPEYSPAAVESDRPLVGALRLQVDLPGWDDELRKLVDVLSLPLLSLPAWCVKAPWWSPRCRSASPIISSS